MPVFSETSSPTKVAPAVLALLAIVLTFLFAEDTLATFFGHPIMAASFLINTRLADFAFLFLW